MGGKKEAGKMREMEQTEVGKGREKEVVVVVGGKTGKEERVQVGSMRSSVVRGTLLSEPVAAVSGAASVRVIRRRVSGSSPSHFVPPLTASRPDCLTDC